MNAPLPQPTPPSNPPQPAQTGGGQPPGLNVFPVQTSIIQAPPVVSSQPPAATVVLVSPQPSTQSPALPQPPRPSLITSVAQFQPVPPALGVARPLVTSLLSQPAPTPIAAPPTTPPPTTIMQPPRPGMPPVTLPLKPGSVPPSGAGVMGKPLAGGPPISAPLPQAAPLNAGGPSSSAPRQPSMPKLAAIRTSPMRFLPFIVGGLLSLGLVIFIVTRFLGARNNQVADTSSPSGTQAQPQRTTVPAQQTTITYWGLWEPSEVLSGVFQEFEQANPGVKIEYVKQSHIDYRERLQTAIASGQGPDLFRFHASWTPMLRNELAVMPNTVYSASEFQQTFYPVASKQLQINGQLVGVPLMYDGLALYYNQDIFKTANVQPPTSWAELRTLATQLTVRSGGQIQRGGMAIGNASNVEHFSDIIGLLMLQNGANLSNPTSTEARDALQFYTNFIKVDKVWSETLPSSTVAFSRGDAAMMLAPSWRVHEIKAMNPNLAFSIAPLPKLGENKVTWATYWAEGVNTQGKNKDASWKLIKFLSSAEAMKKMYSQQSTIRAFGEPYSRVGLANELAGQPLLVPFLADAPNAEGSYLSSYTHDNGLNDQLIKYYEDAVNAILSGRQAADVLGTLNLGTAQVLRQYGVPVTTTSGGSQ